MSIFQRSPNSVLVQTSIKLIKSWNKDMCDLRVMFIDTTWCYFVSLRIVYLCIRIHEQPHQYVWYHQYVCKRRLYISQTSHSYSLTVANFICFLLERRFKYIVAYLHCSYMSLLVVAMHSWLWLQLHYNTQCF